MCSSIRQLEEKKVAYELDILKWSDRMDLVAFSNLKGEVALHRLTWTRAWSLGPKKEGTTVKGLAWRPDGKVLAIGYSSGDVLLINVENKSSLNTLKVDGEISCLFWPQEKKDVRPANIFSINIEEQNDYMKYIDYSSVYLPDPPSLSNFGSNITEENVSSKFFQNQNELNILLIGTIDGFVYISIFGCFPLSVIDINKQVGYKCAVYNLHLSDDLSKLFVTVKNSNLIEVITLHIDIFKTHMKELFTMALKQQHLHYLLNYLSLTITVIKETWENILLEMDSKLSKYASQVPEGKLAADFLDLLMFGVSSDDMQKFLLHDLTKKGLEKFGQTIEMSYANIQKLLLKNITKVGQNLTYHLAELLGMARLEHRYKAVGLLEENITEAISQNGSFLTKGGEIQQIINNAMINYKAFFRWLYTAIMHLMDEPVPPEIPHMTQQDLACIAEFLQNFDNISSKNNSENRKKGFIMEKLGQYLSDSELTIPVNMENSEWHCFLKQNTCLKQHSSIINHNKDLSLLQQYKVLVNSIENIFVQPKLLISKQFNTSNIFKCLRSDTNTPITFANASTDVTYISFLSKKPPADGIFILEFDYTIELVVKAIFVYFNQFSSNESNNEPPQPVLDLSFYSSTILSILLHDNNTKNAVLCQFPLNLVRDKFVPVDTNVELNRSHVNKINGYSLGTVKNIDGMTASKFAVSGNRKISIVLSENKRKVRLFEMEADEDEEEDAEMTNSTLKENDISMMQESSD